MTQIVYSTPDPLLLKRKFALVCKHSVHQKDEYLSVFRIAKY